VEYGTVEGAAHYREKHRRSFLRRLASRRELSLFDRALAQAAAYGKVLDCPCGAGRLGPVLLRRAVRLTAVDISGPMLAEARGALAAPARAGRVAFARSAAHALPFARGAFDVAVCSRLLHHVVDPAERARLLRELARVAGRWVVLSFHDATVLKRRLQGKRARSRVALTPAQLSAEAAKEGLVLVAPVRRVHGWFSLVAVALVRVAPT
jgi:ubiquinone/menaquinone biosynthesis C-methylase UbiE